MIFNEHEQKFNRRKKSPSLRRAIMSYAMKTLTAFTYISLIKK